MKLTFATFLIIFCSIFSYGQTDYDKIFDTKKEERSSLSVGTNVITLLTGTPTVSVSYDIVDKVQMKIGVGITPLGFIFDINAFSTHDLPILQRNLNTGTFFSVGFKYLVNKNGPALNSGKGVYLGSYLEKWYNTNTIYKEISYKRTKFKIVGGLNAGLYEHIDLDIEIGISIGLYRVDTPSGDSEVVINNEVVRSDFNIMGGFNLGLGVNYRF